MSSGERLFATRVAKLHRLAEGGRSAYPTRVPRTHMAAEAARLARDAGDAEVEVDVAGRLMSLRRMGKTTFADLRDDSGSIQLFLNANELGADAYAEALEVLDVGDIVSAGGPLFITRTGEPSVRVRRSTVASKALRPLPEKWHGLQDAELRYRQRYLDLIANAEVRERFEARTEIVRAIRRELDARGFLEVETPTLQPLYGGGNAEPFVTEYEALSRSFYLRIADELYLKRLLVGGYERVYEICKDFRNEGIDATHSPEFTMLEAYQAFADMSDMIELTEALAAAAARAMHGDTVIPSGGIQLDFTPPWRRVTYRDVLLESSGLDIDGAGASDDALRSAADERGVSVSPAWPRARVLDELMKHVVEPTLIQPTIVSRYPRETAPLAKRCDDDPRYVDRFEPFVNGMEIGNAYSELNDPLEQRERMEAQVAAREDGEATAHPLDESFLLALEHGMPPAGGMALGIDRLTMVLTGATNIREVILFPQLRGPA